MYNNVTIEQLLGWYGFTGFCYVANGDDKSVYVEKE